MKTFKVVLQSEASKSFMCQKAANSLDINLEKKLKHELIIDANLDDDYSLGLIVGASGSGKTTLAKNIFGNDCFKNYLDEEKAIIDQFDDCFDYNERSEFLCGVGLTSVPCWLRPVKTLSNGQKARAEIALAISQKDPITLIDEWTSVVDRNVAKIMSHCISKFIRKQKGRKIVLLSCHYDVDDWLNPDWIIDCNTSEFIDRRSLWQNFRREEKIELNLLQTNGSEWKYFSKYHYLSERLPVGKMYHYGLFCQKNQIGYLNFANYVPKRKNNKIIYHFNRLVIHPDYVGMGLGIKFLNLCCKNLKSKIDCEIFGAFSSLPVFKSLSNDPKWMLMNIKRPLKSHGSLSTSNKKFMRTMVTMFSFKYTGD